MKLIFRNTTSGHNDSDHAECSLDTSTFDALEVIDDNRTM